MEHNKKPALAIRDLIPYEWRNFLPLSGLIHSLAKLEKFLEKEYSTYAVFPNREDIFRAFELTAPEDVRVVILGQDPYHGANQATGLAFSVPDGVQHPPSLKNIFKELSDDLGLTIPANGSDGDLSHWARQGVLLLNTVLTVRGGDAGSHQGRGWEELTDLVIETLGKSETPIVFVLWGASAQKKESLIGAQHHVIKSVHPSPLSAYRGFFGSRPFSKINTLLKQQGTPAIKWKEI